MAKGLFATYHPAICMLYFLAAIGFAFSTQHPVYVALSCAMSSAYLVYLRGWRSFVRTMGTCVPLVVFVGLLNSLFNAAGVTILWQWGSVLRLRRRRVLRRDDGRDADRGATLVRLLQRGHY